jgi:hypothetical protein
VVGDIDTQELGLERNAFSLDIFFHFQSLHFLPQFACHQQTCSVSDDTDTIFVTFNQKKTAALRRALSS